MLEMMKLRRMLRPRPVACTNGTLFKTKMDDHSTVCELDASAIFEATATEVTKCHPEHVEPKWTMEFLALLFRFYERLLSM